MSRKIDRNHASIKFACFAGLIALICGCDSDKPQPVAMVSVGYASMAAIKPDGTLWQWGGPCPNTKTPQQIGGNNDWLSVSTGFAHSMAIRRDGSLWAWGDNIVGELGIDGDFQCTPIRLGTQYWESVSAGEKFTMAIRKDGTLWGWGVNTDGQLGIGYKNTYNSSDLKSRYINTPQQVGDQKEWKSVFANVGGSFAIKNDGTLWGWSCGIHCGNKNSPSNQATPTQVGVESTWASVSVSPTHVLALKTDGSLWAWGEQTDGVLGNGVNNNDEVLTPIPIAQNSRWLAASAGNGFSVAIKKDGTLWGWGKSLCHAVGYGQTEPFEISTETDWTAVAAGYSNLPPAAAIKKDNSVWTWGCNIFGKLGTGDTRDKDEPTRIDF